MINKDKLVQRFLHLASINSPTFHENVLADILEAELHGLGFNVLRDDAGIKAGSDTGSLIATKKGSVSGGTPILFSAHMDTVVATDKWGYVIEDGVIRSAGDTILGADDKAGIAAILEALEYVHLNNIPHGDIQVMFSIAEETGLCGARYLDLSLITSRCAFVFDVGKPVGCVTVSAPSHDNIIAKIHGKASHAGANPEDGINAIVVASKAISKMNLGRIDPQTTANIGVISGGTARNIVPEYCEVKGEARSRNADKLKLQVDHMVKAFEDAAAELGASVDVEVKRSYDGYLLSEKDEVVRIALEAAKQAGIAPEMHETGGGSDANILNIKGLPATVIGVGYENAHAINECIAIDDLVKATDMALSLIKVAAGQ